MEKIPCTIRKWRLSDAADLAKALSNKKILNNLRDGLPYPYTEQDARDYITAMLAADENDTFAYAVTVDDRAIGSIGAFRQDNIHGRTAELGYYLAEEYWGKGIMTDAVRQLCDLIFTTTDIIRIFAEPFTYNRGSRRVLEKAGFQYEGLLRQNAVKNGRTEDMAMYALTRSPEPYLVKRLSEEDLPGAKDLIWEVFCQFEAPDYPEEGVREFRKILEDEAYIRSLDFYGAYAKGELAGVLAVREPRHISFFFVKEAWQSRGIGRRLFETIRQDYERQEFTVNSSPYAVKVYRCLGFTPTATEQMNNGIRYTPMQFTERTLTESAIRGMIS